MHWPGRFLSLLPDLVMARQFHLFFLFLLVMEEQVRALPFYDLELAFQPFSSHFLGPAPRPDEFKQNNLHIQDH